MNNYFTGSLKPDKYDPTRSRSSSSAAADEDVDVKSALGKLLKKQKPADILSNLGSALATIDEADHSTEGEKLSDLLNRVACIVRDRVAEKVIRGEEPVEAFKIVHRRIGESLGKMVKDSSETNRQQSV